MKYIHFFIPILILGLLSTCSSTPKKSNPIADFKLTKQNLDVSSPTFAEVIGVNGGLFMGDTATLRRASVFNNNRTFYLMDHDMKGRLPKDFLPGPCEAVCPNINCDWENTNAAWKMRFCTWSKLFETNTIALEVWGGEDRKYPHKFFTVEELGNPYRAGLAYGRMIGTSLDGLVDVVEVGNEPHGNPGIEAFNEWSRGVVEGVKATSQNMRLASADVQNSGPEKFGKYLLNNQVKDIDTSLFEILQVHSYAFDKNFRVTRAPETILHEMVDMQPYKDKELWFGEVGWDSELLSEKTQAGYILRTIVHAMRWDFDKVFVYNILDDGPWAAPFDHTGLLNSDSTPKQSYNLLVKMVTEFGDYSISKVLKDGQAGEYAYEFSNGDKAFVISWHKDDTDIPKMELL